MQPANEPLLEKCVKFAEYVLLLENAVCPFKMYRHGVTGKHKKEGYGDFLVG